MEIGEKCKNIVGLYRNLTKDDGELNKEIVE